MRRALQLAENACTEDEIPVGAIIMSGEALLGEGFNRNIGQHDPTAHAEIIALRQACTYMKNHRIPGADIYVTLEPCPMCFHALVQARVKRIIIGARDPKGGFSRFFGEEHLKLINHRPELIFGILDEPCSDIISQFFKEKRSRGKRKWMRNS